MWKFVDTAVTGKSHKDAGIPCQDKVKGRKYKGNVCVITLADGAGSARLSHFGAKAVSERINTELGLWFDEYFAENDAAAVRNRLFQVISKTLDEVSWQLRCSRKDLASTLLAVAVSGSRYIAVHIGDGVIGCLKDGKIVTASAPRNGEFLNETMFTVSPDAEKNIRIMKGEGKQIGGFVLMSDGTENSFYNRRSGQLSEGLVRIMGLLADTPEEDFRERLTHDMEETVALRTRDDCSLSILVNSDAFAKASEDTRDVKNTDHTVTQRKQQCRLTLTRKALPYYRYETGIGRADLRIIVHVPGTDSIRRKRARAGLADCDTGRRYRRYSYTHGKRGGNSYDKSF